MSSLNKNTRNQEQKTKQREENPSMKINMAKIEHNQSGDTICDSKSPVTKKIKISESGDNNDTFYVSRSEIDAAESTLETTIAESTSGRSTTYSSFDETLAETTFGKTYGELSLNSTFGKQSLDESVKKRIGQIETVTEPNKGNILGGADNKSDKSSTNDFDASAYFSFSSSSSSTDSDVPKKSSQRSQFYRIPKPYKSKKPSNMFTKYRENPVYNIDTSSSYQSKFDESWLSGRGNDDDQGDLPDIEALMRNLTFSSDTKLREEKERKDKIHKKYGDGFGPDAATTHLLLLASKTLETYQVNAEESIDNNVEGIEKNEGLDRSEMVLEEVDNSLLQQHKRDKIEKNLVEFNKIPILTNVKRPFRSQKKKHAYFVEATIPALYMHAAKVNKVLSQRRGGYASI